MIELAKACIVDKNIIEIVRPHLSYAFLTNEQEKLIFKYIFDYHSAHNSSPTVGLLSQNVNSRDALNLIGKIREINVYDKKDALIGEFQKFIKRARTVDLLKKSSDLYNQGDFDKAVDVLAEEGTSINEFSLKRKAYSRIYEGFEKRMDERQNRDYSTRKIPTGIPAHDHFTRGGTDRGTGFLGIARSGAGKTTLIRSLIHHASMRGIPCIHFAGGDSTQSEIEDGYDAMWTGVETHMIREGDLSGADLNKIEKALKALRAQAGEIIVHTFKQFHSASILDCRAITIDVLKDYPDLGFVGFDLLESFDPGDGKKYSTNQDGISAKKKATSEKIVNCATEFDIAVGAVTQASDIKKEQWNNPNYTITRSEISNLKAAIDPFSYCVTLNQTEDEKDNGIMRIREEKTRHYGLQSWQSTYHIAQRLEVGRFIDIGETNRRFWNPETKQIIRHKPKPVKT